jgi:hypothetical protein
MDEIRVQPVMSESKADEGKFEANELSGEEVLKKVQKFFYEDDSLANFFESFVDSKAAIFDLNSTEYKLEYTSVYNEFKELFESKMSDFILKDLNSTIETFYEALEKKTNEDEKSTEAVFGQIMISVTDFDIFINMLREAAQKLAKNNA